jgi:peptidoglycan/LPS O-acetylase OafA/YrhL
MELKGSGASRIFGLDFLRASAIALVVVSHSEMFLTDSVELSHYFHYAGLQGVELFFALSGFLIGSILVKENISNFGQLQRFYLRRWMRTLPAFYVAFAIFYLFYDPDLSSALRAASFTANLTPSGASQGLSFFGVSWSLAIEEWFYLLLGFALLMFGFNARAVFFLWVFVFFGRSAFLIFSDQASYDVAHTSVLLRLDALMVGVFAALMRQKYLVFPGKVQWALRFFYVFGLGSLFSVWVAYPWIQYSSKTFYLVFFPLNSIFLALLVSDFSVTSGLFSGLSGGLYLLARRIVTFVSVISYSIYLYHLEVILLADRFEVLSDTEKFLFSLVFILVVGYCSYTLIERPFLILRDRTFRRKEGDVA